MIVAAWVVFMIYTVIVENELGEQREIDAGE